MPTGPLALFLRRMMGYCTHGDKTLLQEDHIILDYLIALKVRAFNLELTGSSSVCSQLTGCCDAEQEESPILNLEAPY